MNHKVASFFSYLLHPAIFPVLGVFMVLKTLPYHVPSQAVILTVALVFCGTYIIPLAVSFLLFRLKVIRNMLMTEARDRRLPYAFGAFCFYITSLLLREVHLPSETYIFLLASAAVLILHLFMLNFTKPSAHLAGIGGFLGLLLALSLRYGVNYLPWIVLGVFLSGLLASARLTLKSHNLSEIGLGFFTGLLLVGVVVFFN